MGASGSTAVLVTRDAREDARPSARDELPWNRILLAIVLVGVGLRTAQYLSRQSYWNDEASLVLNIFNHSARQLIGPLEHDQASPPLFLLAMRGMYVMFGRSEYGMRLLPLVLSIAALVLFARIVRITLPPAIAAITLALFAVSDHLITHAAEAKQYSGDVFVAASLLLSAIHGSPEVPAHKRLERSSILACVLIWFSHPTAFVFGGIAMALLPAAAREKQVSIARVLLAMFAPAVSFVALYFVSIRQQQSQMLFEYWQERFVDFSQPLLLPWWLLKAFVGVFNYPYDRGGAVLLPLGIIGAIHLWRTGKRELLGILVIPILLTLLAATAKRYPFGGTRLTVFLAPATLLLAGYGLAILARDHARKLGASWHVLIALLIGLNGAVATYHLFVPRYRGNMRPAVEYVRAHRQPGDYVYARRDEELLAYWPDPDERVHLGGWPKHFHGERFWVLLSFGPSRESESQLPRHAERFGEPIDRFETRGGAALLFAPHADSLSREEEAGEGGGEGSSSVRPTERRPSPSSRERE
jgi:hypothetical protein